MRQMMVIVLLANLFVFTSCSSDHEPGLVVVASNTGESHGVDHAMRVIPSGLGFCIYFDLVDLWKPGIDDSEFEWRVSDTISLSIDGQKVAKDDLNLLSYMMVQSVLDENRRILAQFGDLKSCIDTAHLSVGTHTAVMTLSDAADLEYLHTWQFEIVALTPTP